MASKTLHSFMDNLVESNSLTLRLIKCKLKGLTDRLCLVPQTETWPSIGVTIREGLIQGQIQGGHGGQKHPIMHYFLSLASFQHFLR